MRGQRISFIATSVVALTSLWPAIAAPVRAEARGDCVRKGERAVHRTAEAVVAKGGGAIFGCLLSRGVRVRLDRRPRDFSFQIYGPIGRYVAVRAAGGEPCSYPGPCGGGDLDYEDTSLMLFDLRSGRGYSLFRGRTYVGIGGPLKAVVNQTGTVVFVLRREDFDFRLMACEVRRCYTGQRATAPRELDRSNAAFDDIRLAGNTVTWASRGTPRTTTVD